MAARYAGFLTDAASATTVTLDAAGPARAPLGNAPVTARLSGGRLIVEQAGDEPWGWLDRADGRGRVVPHRSMAALDVLLRADATVRALEAGGCAFHAAAVVLADGAHLFPGVSGAGKSTVAQHLAREGGRVLSDEFVVVVPSPGGVWTVHGSPFWLGSAEPARLARAWQLGRGERAAVTGLDAGSVARLLTQNLSLVVEPEGGVARALAVVARLAGDVKGGELRYGLGQPIRGHLERAA
ncbi:MAG: hypothetical protein HY904_07415 [Deltaproteobacteria bacterium]|nr:hypothetical protein [Deltaproteobacteria bacterium]